MTKIVLNRKELIKKRGEIVDITYLGIDDKECFCIGFFFNLNETHARLKITSTYRDTYECVDIPVEKIQEIKSYDFQ